jgi:Rod binding domain-containing protein
VSALPPIDDRLLPADVRAGTQDDKAQYKAALAFERQLVTQLTQQLGETAQGDDEGGSAATTQYKEMLPGVLADSVMESGGLGLARQIAQSLKERSNPTTGPAGRADEGHVR